MSHKENAVNIIIVGWRKSLWSTGRNFYWISENKDENKMIVEWGHGFAFGL